jgi:hypothetical protein
MALRATSWCLAPGRASGNGSASGSLFTGDLPGVLEAVAQIVRRRRFEPHEHVPIRALVVRSDVEELRLTGEHERPLVRVAAQDEGARGFLVRAQAGEPPAAHLESRVAPRGRLLHVRKVQRQIANFVPVHRRRG